MPCAVQIKKSPRPQQTLRITPVTHPRQFPSPRGNVGQLSRQVFWLMVHPTPRAFPSMNRTVAFTGFVPIYSGGTARDLHPLPLPRSHIVESTLGDREEGCQGHYCPSPPGLLMQPPPTYEKAPDRQCGECGTTMGLTHGSRSERLLLLLSKPNLQSPTTSTKHTNHCESYSAA
jgi:hypothetical protein